MILEYWNTRKNDYYYSYLFNLVKKCVPSANSMIDIGSLGIPFIDEFDWIPEKYSLDIAEPYTSENVIGIKQDFYQYAPENPFDLALCMQVLEHVEHPKQFAQKLFDIAQKIIITVPYKWPIGSCKPWHIHDMIDEETMFQWTGRPANVQFIVPELKFWDGGRNALKVLICGYNFLVPPD